VAVLPPEIMPALQGVYPSVLVTCSADGTPNTTMISQVYYVDPEHVALSFQFFNKTSKNVRENPRASVDVMTFDFDLWNLGLRFDHSEQDGPIFDAMDMQLEAIASMSGMSGVFKLRAADVYFVESVRKIEGMFT
jgi:flavin reductase (DIM6/NTAB) family NADH-FMN oxidoreductase RutF